MGKGHILTYFLIDLILHEMFVPGQLILDNLSFVESK